MRNLIILLFIINHLVSFGQVNDTIESGKFRVNTKSKQNLATNPKMDNYDVVYYGLNLEATNTSKLISSGIVTIKAKVVGNPMSEFVIQLIDQLIVSKVKLNGTDVTFTHLNDEISFMCPSSVAVDELFTVEVHYSGTPQGSGWSNTYVGNWNTNVTYTLSESFHAYEWFPAKQSLTDKADSADIYVTVPSNLEVASNGILKQVVDVGGTKKRYEWQSRYPINYYLISVTISDFQEYNTYANPVGLGKQLLIQNYVYNSSNCLSQYKSAIDGTAAMIELYSNLFGMYPFPNEKYGHAMAPIGGGMEHQTMTTLSSFSNGLIAHELAHMWFGDYVTCKTWQDIWINEGFASYAEYLNLQKLSNQANADSWMYNAQSSARQYPNGSVFLNPTEALNEARIFSSQLSYKKGATIIHMLRHEINNDDVFFSILKQFLQRFGHSTASGEDFKAVVNEITGQDYSWFFDQWYYGYGYPTFSANFGFTNDKPCVTISQTPSNTSTPLFKTSMDIKITHYDNSTTTQRIFVSQNPQTFTFDIPLIKSLKIDPAGWLLYKLGTITSTSSAKNNENWISIGPNPFSDKILVNIPEGYLNIKVTISDITGKIVNRSNYNEQQFEVNTSNLPQGIYFINITDGKRLFKEKLIKG